MEKKSIVFYVFNIFNPGGTTRSCVNMIKNSIENDIFNTIYIVNHQGVKRKDKKNFYKTHNLNPQKVRFISLKKLKKLNEEFDFLITREDFLPISSEIKDYENSRYIIGEIHAPLEYIKDKYLFLENLDFIKVNTKKIYEEFKEKYNYENVIYNYVSLDHLHNIEQKNINISKEINFYVLSRFEEYSKNISYIIRYVDHLLKNNQQVKLYLDGYGPNRNLYEYLIKEYNLEDSIFINSEEKPKDLVPISASRYETFGFSIIEGIHEYGACLFYPGIDDNLKEIYPETNNVKYLSLDLEKDYQVFLEFKNNYNSNEASYTKDIINKLDDYNYMKNYMQKAKFVLDNSKEYNINLQSDYYRYLKDKTIDKSRYMNIINFLKKILPYKMISFKTRRKILKKVEKLRKTNEFEKYIIEDNTYFIETFHGKNFSGNPKALAFEIRKENPNANIYVSSINTIVDIEIFSLGFKPIRFNSLAYKEAYKKSKYIISNGNILLGLPKLEGQIHIQTWHGLPLKNMVYDLNDKKERKEQVEAILPRMEKWDYLLTAGGEYTKLLSSAFNLKENNHVKIIEKGMPRVNYIKTVDKDEIKVKYGIDTDKKVILFSPTWRKEKRESVTELDLLNMVEHFKDYVIILKLHPLEGYIRNEYKDLHPRIIVPLIEFSDINELYAISDILISDYSSVIFDYMHLSRPIIINQEDEEEYGKDIGFYFDIEKETGLKANNFNTKEMIEAIEDKVNKEYDYSKFINKYTPKDQDYIEGEILKVTK